MRELSADGKCVVCGKGGSLNRYPAGLGIDPMEFMAVAHAKCWKKFQEGEVLPTALWKSSGIGQKENSDDKRPEENSVKKAHIMTNADRIRSMTDKELLNFLICIKASYIAVLNDETPMLPTKSTEWAAWLKEEIK